MRAESSDTASSFKCVIWFGCHFLISIKTKDLKTRHANACPSLHSRLHGNVQQRWNLRIHHCCSGEEEEKKKGYSSKWNCQLPFNATQWPFEPQLFVSVFTLTLVEESRHRPFIYEQVHFSTRPLCQQLSKGSHLLMSAAEKSNAEKKSISALMCTLNCIC